MPDLKVTCTRCDSEVTHRCNNESLEKAALELLKWRPENGFPRALRRDNDHYDKGCDSEFVPFFSETFLYALLGKSDARTLLARIRNLFRSMGLEPDEFEEAAGRFLEKAEAEKVALEERRQENRKRHNDMLRPVSRRRQDDGTRLCEYGSFYAFDENVERCEEGRCNKLSTPIKPNMSPVLQPQDGVHVVCRNCKTEHFSSQEQVDEREREPEYQGKYAEIRSEKLRAKLTPP